MRILIDMDEDVRVAITRIGLLRISDEMQKKVDKAIQHGIPLPKGHWIDANKIITAQLYDDQYEEYKEEPMTIAEYLDRYTDEGCPVSIIDKDGD